MMAKMCRKQNIPATMPYEKYRTTTFGATALTPKPMNQTTEPTSVTMRQP